MVLNTALNYKPDDNKRFLGPYCLLIFHSHFQLFMAQLQSLQDLFVHGMQALYSAETLLVESMPRMVENTQNEELRTAFTVHLEETRQQIQRLEQAAQMLGVDPNGEENVALQGLIAEGEKLMQKDASPEVLDAALIAAAQKIEHYEIAGYGTAAYLAEELGHNEVAQLLQQTLQEEKKTDELLNQIAKNKVNRQAEQA